jgi:hypothetical protein
VRSQCDAGWEENELRAGFVIAATPTFARVSAPPSAPFERPACQHVSVGRLLEFRQELFSTKFTGAKSRAAAFFPPSLQVRPNSLP